MRYCSKCNQKSDWICAKCYGCENEVGTVNSKLCCTCLSADLVHRQSRDGLVTERAAFRERVHRGLPGADG
jgi:hypothetical protein